MKAAGILRYLSIIYSKYRVSTGGIDTNSFWWWWGIVVIRITGARPGWQVHFFYLPNWQVLFGKCGWVGCQKYGFEGAPGHCLVVTMLA